MEKNSISQDEKELFLINLAPFDQELETVFCDYFACLYTDNDTKISHYEAKKVALATYRSLLQCENEVPQELLEHLRCGSRELYYVVARSFLFLLEKYGELSERHVKCSQLGILIGYVNRFVDALPSDLLESITCQPCDASFDTGFSQESIFTPSNTLIDVFQRMRGEKQKITFLNLYKGVPISSEAEIIEIEDENVTFKIDRLQEIAMKLEAQAFIVKNEWFSKHLKADIIESNFQTNTIVLSNFTYLLNMPAIQREFVRVHPDILAKVYLRPSHSLPTSGRLYDLSINGLGVVSSENNGIYVGAKVSVTFELNSATIAIDGDKTIELQGEIVNIIDYQGSFRYCMRIFPDRIMSKKILNYISQREKEILEDLNQELEAYSV